MTSSHLPSEFERNLRELARAFRAATPLPSVPANLASDLEWILTDPDSTKACCDLLTTELGSTAPESAAFDGAQIQRIMNEGLHWLPTSVLIELAIDRGAIESLADLIDDEWPTYWWGVYKSRQVPGEDPASDHHDSATPTRRAENATQDRLHAIDDWSHFLALDDDNLLAAAATEAVPDRVLPVFESQVRWLSPAATQLTIVWRISPDNELKAKVSPLLLATARSASAALADTNCELILPCEAAEFEFRAHIAAGFVPEYFVCEYQSSTRDVLFAVSLSNRRLEEDEFVRVILAFVKSLAERDPDRANSLEAAVS